MTVIMKINDIKINDIKTREVLNGRGEQSLEVDVVLDNGIIGRTIVPTGSSIGNHEANAKCSISLNSAITQIKSELKGMCPTDQVKIDNKLIELDGSPNKERLGSNVLLGTSLAVAKAAAISNGVPLFKHIAANQNIHEMPVPIFSMISGGLHGGLNMDFQDCQIIPIMPGKDFKSLVQVGVQIHKSLKNLLAKNKMPIGVSATGGFMPPLSSNEEAFQLITEAVESQGYEIGVDIGLSMDVAAEMFYSENKYHLKCGTLNSDEFIDYLENIVDKYKLVLIEDPLGDNDIEGWKTFYERMHGKIEITGDDLFATNIKRFNSLKNVANSILIKPNQIGTLTETLTLMKKVNEITGYGTVLSRRSGETEDTTIADIAVAAGAKKIKFGSLNRSEGLAKYNQLIRIEEMLNMDSASKASNY